MRQGKGLRGVAVVARGFGNDREVEDAAALWRLSRRRAGGHADGDRAQGRNHSSRQHADLLPGVSLTCVVSDEATTFAAQASNVEVTAAAPAQPPGRPWIAGKNRSCHAAGRRLMLPTLAMNSPYCMRFSGEMV